MAAIHAILTLYYTVLQFTLSQYITGTPLTPDNAALYCARQCLSTLGSIHNEHQLQSVQSLSNYDIGNGIWIGLKAVSENKYEWTDATPFDFAKWALNEPNGNPINEACTAMSTVDFEWSTHECTAIKRRSLCNHCNGVINKYILFTEESLGYSYASALQQCRTYNAYSTLASIHSQRDLSEAHQLCSLYGPNADCLIGLNDLVNEGIYVYEDETIFDFMSSSLTIHHQSKDCIHLHNGTHLKDTLCDGTESLNYALCQMPSMICYIDTLWTKINGNADILSNNDCTKIFGEYSEFVMGNTLWYNGPNTLIIDYTFHFTVDTAEQSGYSGVTVYNSKEGITCHYYFIFIQKIANAHNSYYIGLLFQHGSTTNILQRLAIPSETLFTPSSLLSIHISPNTNEFHIYLNQVLLIRYTDTRHSSLIKHDGYSGYIGIKTSQFTQTVAKSLYVSGTGYNNVITAINIIKPNDCPTSAPTLSPTTVMPTVHTLHPSLAPTVTPSVMPSLSPTLKPTPNPSVSPSQSPSTNPTVNPSAIPTDYPTFDPTQIPTTNVPTVSPTNVPSLHPSGNPSVSPTNAPTNIPSTNPSPNPSPTPTNVPTQIPTNSPSAMPTKTPTSMIEIGSIITAQILVIIDATKNRLNILFEFEHIFRVSQDVNDIIYILESITMKLIISDCGYSSGFESVRVTERSVKERMTQINASITVCDDYSSLVKAINNLGFEQELITAIKAETAIQIVFNEHTIIKYKQTMGGGTHTTAMMTVTNKTIASGDGQNSNNQLSDVSWMLKLILLQLGLCCFLIVCYFGLKIRTKKLKVNTLATQQQIEQEKSKQNIVIAPNYPNIYSPKYEGVTPNNFEENMTEPFRIPQSHLSSQKSVKKFNNSGGISSFAMPTETNGLSDRSDESEMYTHTENGHVSEHKHTSEKYTNFYIRQLMAKMIANKNRKSNNLNVAKDTHFHRIETDHTFPSIPITDAQMIEFDDELNGFDGSEEMISVNDHLSAPIPDSVHSDLDSLLPNSFEETIHNSLQKLKQSRRDTQSSSVEFDKFTTNSYVTICDKCGTAHPRNESNNGGFEDDSDGQNSPRNCAAFGKFHKNLY